MFIESVMPSNQLILCWPFSSWLQFFPVSESFLINQFSASGSQSIEASVSASVLPINIQYWFPLGLTGLIFIQYNSLSRAFSNFKSIDPSALSFLFGFPLRPSFPQHLYNLLYSKVHLQIWSKRGVKSACTFLKCCNWDVTKSKLAGWMLGDSGGNYSHCINQQPGS